MEDLDDLSELKEIFFLEADTLIESLENQILLLEKDLENQEAVHEIFRVAHTLKGGAGTVGFDRVARFTHHMEDLLDSLREGQISIHSDFVDFFLETVDLLKALLDSAKNQEDLPPDYEKSALNSIQKLLGKDPIEYQDMQDTSEDRKEDIEDTRENIKEDTDLIIQEEQTDTFSITQQNQQEEGIPSNNEVETDQKVNATEEWLEDPLHFNEYERSLILDGMKSGQKLFEVTVRFDMENPMSSVSGIQILSLIQDITHLLKSEPDMEDFLEEETPEQVKFFLLSELSEEELKQRITETGVVYSIDIQELQLDNVNPIETGAHEILSIQKEDLEKIQTHLIQGKKVFKVSVSFQENNPMRTLSGVLFHNMLSERGKILLIHPSLQELKEDIFYPKMEAIFSTFVEKEELKKKLFLKDIVQEISLQEFMHKSNSSEVLQSPQSTRDEIRDEMDEGKVEVIEPLETTEKETRVETTLEEIEEIERIETKSLSDSSELEETPIQDGVNKVSSQQESVNKVRGISSDLRVDSARVDDIMNLVGELVILKSGFHQLNDSYTELLSHFQSVLNEQKYEFQLNVQDLKDFLLNLLSVGESNVTSGLPSNNYENSESIETLSQIRLERSQWTEKVDKILSEPFLAIHRRWNDTLLQYKESHIQMNTMTQNLNRILENLQTSVMKIRMLPVRYIFQRFSRLVRDLSRSLEKEIQLILEGEETQMDKGIAEVVLDPMIHLVRNAIHHGIESPLERKAQGKDPEGSILLSAEQEGNYILIRIQDDGRGLDLEKIEKIAREKKLLSHENLFSDEILDCIFLPGFSTVNEVSSISGRGVGLDVVRKKIDSLGGSIHVDSTPQKGCVFLLRIPLTLLIVQAILVQVERHIYSIPIHSVLETLKIQAEQIDFLDHVPILRLKEEAIPIAYLRELFDHNPRSLSRSDSFYALIVTDSNRRMALIVDDLIEEQDIVIKSLEHEYARVEGITGATILGNGQVSLVLDVGGLFHLVEETRSKVLALMQ